MYIEGPRNDEETITALAITALLASLSRPRRDKGKTLMATW